VERVAAKYGDAIQMPTQDWHGLAKTRVTLTCVRHDRAFETRAEDLLRRNSGCSLCKQDVSRQNLSASHAKGPPNKGRLKYDTPGFVEAVRHSYRERGLADRYDWSRCVYRGNAIKVELVCPVEGHGAFTQLPTAVWRADTCPACNRARQGDHLRGDFNSFATAALAKFGEKFEYEKQEFRALRLAMPIVCREHDFRFDQRPFEHLAGHMICPGCKGERQAPRRVEVSKRLLARCAVVHGSKYDYSRVDLSCTGRELVAIRCPVHGEFRQSLQHHAKGHGCAPCGYLVVGEKLRTAEADLMARLSARWGDAYEFDVANYESSRSKTSVRCVRHDIWFQSSTDVLFNKKVRFPCPKCFSMSSAQQIEWLDHLGVPDDIAHREVWLKVGLRGRKVPVDGFMNNVVYQFHGDWVHGRDPRFSADTTHPLRRNGMTFDEVYQDTLARDQAIRDAGYELVVMWDSEWKEIRSEALGLPPPPEELVIPAGMGRCSKCKTLKPRSGFSLHRGRPCGLQCWCKECAKGKTCSSKSTD
jgi:hypothetical protein